MPNNEGVQHLSICTGRGQFRDIQNYPCQWVLCQNKMILQRKITQHRFMGVIFMSRKKQIYDYDFYVMKLLPTQVQRGVELSNNMAQFGPLIRVKFFRPLCTVMSKSLCNQALQQLLTSHDFRKSLLATQISFYRS